MQSTSLGSPQLLSSCPCCSILRFLRERNNGVLAVQELWV